MEKQVRDVVKFGSVEDVEANLVKIKTTAEQLLSRMRTELPRTERNFVLYNLLSHTTDQVNRLRTALADSTPVLAWVARSLFELNLVVRYILSSNERLEKFTTEAFVDQIQIYEGFLHLQQEDTPQKTIQLVQDQLSKLRSILDKHGRKPAKKLLGAGEMADDLGVKDEYAAFFKLYSKYVHPTSFLVNSSPQVLASFEFVRTIFLINSQKYALNSLYVIQEATGIRIDGPIMHE
jgi:hypothetical protein